MKKNILSFLAALSLSFASAQSINDSLYNAVLGNDLVKTIALIKRGADVNYVKSTEPWLKVNALITAVNKGYYEMTRLLINKNADLNWKDTFNKTALMYAAAKGNREMVKLLVERGADVSAEGGNGHSVLSAAKEGKNDDVIKYIEEKLKEK